MTSFNIRTKLIISYILFAVLAVLVGVIGLFSLNRTLENLETIKSNYVHSILAVNGISNGFNTIDSGEKAIINPLISRQERQSQYSRIDDAWGQINGAIEAYSEIPKNAEESENWQKFTSAFEQWKSGHEKLVSMVNSREKGKINVSLHSITEQAFDLNAVSSGPVIMMLDKITETTSANIESISKVSDRDSYIAKISIIAAIIAGMAISLLFSIFFSITINKSISLPIKLIKEKIKGMSEGDLRNNFEITTNDEFGTLLNMVNTFNSNIGSIIKKIHGASEDLANTSKEMHSTSESFSDTAQYQSATMQEFTATLEQIAAGMEHISENARCHDDNLNRMIKIISLLSDSIKDLDSTICESLTHTELISAEAKRGETSLREMSDSMNNILSSSDAMKNIVGIISDISEQINLLSLNAAIEAARAGETGRGFAVVADEISKLADQTASSIKEIDSLIKSNYDEINMGIDRIKRSISITGAIIEGVSKITKIIESISDTVKNQMNANSEITESITEVLDLSEQTKTATEEQKLSTLEITKSITSMNQMAQINASGAEELSGSSSSLAYLAETLKVEIQFFRI